VAGHSRWAQVKHKKAATDTKKGQLFSKLIREITIAARIGGENPETNARLRTAVERARQAGLPKENMERALARAKGEGDTATLQEFLYEATTPDGIMVLIEGITDNKNRALAEIRQILLSHHARLADQGGVLWNFEKIGSVVIRREQNAGRPPEEVELAIVDAGAEDFTKETKGWVVETKLRELDEIRKRLEAAGIFLDACGPAFRARSPLSVDAARRVEIEKLFEELNDHHEVQEIYSNVAGGSFLP